MQQDLTEAEAKKKREGKRWEVFEGFLGLIKASSLAELKETAINLTEMVEEAQKGTDSPEYLQNYILKELAGPQLQIMKCKSCQVGHISRDATEIEVREKPPKATKAETEFQEKKAKKKRGRPKKGEESVKEPTRLERQRTMTLEEMLKDLPCQCDVGTKKNSKGYRETCTGYKLHVDAADGQIPVSCILTSASTHDTQVALPLAAMTSQRVTNLYDLADAAYAAPIIREYSRSLGHVPIIDVNPRRNAKLKEELRAEERRLDLLHFELPEDRRYKGRTNVERVYARLKDEFGGRMIRVRGWAKVMTHLMFGILALTADQLIRLVVQPVT